MSEKHYVLCDTVSKYITGRRSVPVRALLMFLLGHQYVPFDEDEEEPWRVDEDSGMA